MSGEVTDVPAPLMRFAVLDLSDSRTVVQPERAGLVISEKNIIYLQTRELVHFELKPNGRRVYTYSPWRDVPMEVVLV